MIAKKSFVIMASNAVCSILGLLVLFIIARLWGDFATEALGVIGFGMAFVGIFSFISDLGFGSAHIKKISEGKDLGTCIGTYLTIKLILTGILVLVVVGSILIWKHVLNQGFYDSTKESVIYIFLLFYVILSLSQVPFYTFNAKKEINRTQISSLTETFTRVPLMIAVALAGVTGAYVGISSVGNGTFIAPKYAWPEFLQSIQIFLANHAIGALASTYLLGALAAFIIALIMFRKYPIKRPNKEYAKSYLVFALPMMIVSIIGIVTVNVDKLMLGYFWAAQEVGYYFAVQRISTILVMFSTAVGVLLFPTISSLHTRKKFREIRKVTIKADRYLSLFLLPLVVFIIIFSRDIIRIVLSNSFEPATETLRILTVYAFIWSLGVPYIYLILGMNKPKQYAKIVVSGSILNIILNVLLIPDNGLLSKLNIMGPNGAALASLISVILMGIMYRMASKKIIKIRKFQPRTLLHVFAATMMGVVLYLLATLDFTMRWYYLVIFGLIGLGIYSLILWTLKELKKSDITLIMDSLKIFSKNQSVE